MKLNLNEFFKIEKEQFEKMTVDDKFRQALIWYWDNPYLWGEENAKGADCSGAICFALMVATEKPIRLTASGLYYEIFIDQISPDNPGVLFWTTRKRLVYPGKTYEIGDICHVAGFVGDRVILNMTKPKAKFETLWDVGRTVAKNNDYELDMQCINWPAFHKISDSRTWSLDKELLDIMEE